MLAPFAFCPVRLVVRVILLMMVSRFCILATVPAAEPPKMLFLGASTKNPTAAGGASTGYAIMRLPDGSFAFYSRTQPAAGPLTLPDRDGKMHVLLPGLPDVLLRNEALLTSGILANTQVILSDADTVRSVYVQLQSLTPQQVAEVGLPRYLNVWFRQASPAKIGEPIMTWQGYNGSQMEYQQLKSGRLLVPHGSFQPHARTIPPTGRNTTVIEYSDDGGQSWKLSDSQLTSPCYDGFNGANEGACEPAFEELRDGRLWMLMRTQAGFLYESTSSDDGTSWAAASPSRFNTSTGPPNIMRHRNGWLVVTWNNCEMPPRSNGDGVYGGRDALHIAVSDDEGHTWRGFREIYLDHRRNDNPAASGDRGTAYPLAAYTQDGTIVVLAGQGEGGRNPILVDPDWITETTASTDFSDGLRQWSVYKHFGPAKRWWQARAVGCELIETPGQPETRSLRIRRPDELPADGAVWNFPNAWKGSLTARVLLPAGSQGGTISVNDRMFDPSNDAGEKLSVFQCELNDSTLSPDVWHDVMLRWDLTSAECALTIDGGTAKSLPLKNPTLNGISYVRFRSSATSVDNSGILLDKVSVLVDDPYAPDCTLAQKAAHHQKYVEVVVPDWTAP